MVTDVNNKPIPSVNVSVIGSHQTALTDATGKFSITPLQEGQLQIYASHNGYAEVSLPVTIKAAGTFVHVTMCSSKHLLDEVVVKDRHIQERKQNESLSIEVVNQTFIQRNLGGSLMTTLSRLPGIKTIGIGSGQSKPLIRGLGFNRVVVVDKGVKHEGQQWGADHGLEIDQFAAGEVELIKGAASFLYGSDAIGGVINIKPPAPPEPHTPGGSVDLIGKTNNNLYGTSTNLFGRSQHWYFDSRVTYQNYGDYRVPTDRVFVYDFEVPLYKQHLRNTAGRETDLHLNMGFLGKRFSSTFYLSNIFNQSGFFANAHGLEPRMVNTALHDASARDIQMPSQEVNHFKLINRSNYKTGNHQFQTELGYQHNFRQEFSQYVNHGFMPPVYPDTLGIPANLEREYDKHIYSLNLRDQIRMGRHELTVGVNGEHQNNAINGWTFLVPGFKQTTAGAFAYDQYQLNERMLLHGAIRYDHGQVNLFKYQDWFESQVTEGNTPVLRKLVRTDNLKRNYNSLVWSLGLNYNANKFMLKANVGKSFRMPIVKESGANGVNYHYFSYEIGDPSLSPEQSYQADLSLGWTEEKWSVLVSPFYNYFPNYIYLNPTAEHSQAGGAGNQVFRYAQSQVMRYGGEVQVKYQLLKGLSTELLGEYIYAEQLSGDKKGFTLPFSPPPSALLNLTWSPSISKTLSNSYLSVDYRITAAQNNIVPPEKKTPSYKVINVQAGTRIHLYQQPIMLSLQAQNLLNTRYLNHTSFYRLIELPEMGRNVILSLKVPFNIHKTHPEQANN
jgi:iron complex outermembrane receptor protein